MSKTNANNGFTLCLLIDCVISFSVMSTIPLVMCEAYSVFVNGRNVDGQNV